MRLWFSGRATHASLLQVARSHKKAPIPRDAGRFQTRPLLLEAISLPFFGYFSQVAFALSRVAGFVLLTAPARTRVVATELGDRARQSFDGFAVWQHRRQPDPLTFSGHTPNPDNDGCLAERDPAVNNNILAGHKIRSGRGKKNRGSEQILWFTDTP